MPQTAWSIQIRMQTASTAPKMFGQLAATAKKAGLAVEGAQKHVTGFGEAAEKATTPVNNLAKASRGLSTAFKKIPNDLQSNLNKASRSFTVAGRAAGTFSRVTRAAAAASATSFAGVAAAVDGVRTNANSAAAAVRGIASAARSIPKNIKLNVQQPNAHPGSSNGAFSPATLGAAVGGAVAGSTLLSGVEGASTLQGSTLQAAIAMGKMGPNLDSTTANMSQTADIAFAMSKMTGQDISDSMGVIAAMTSAGVSPDQLAQIYKPIAQFTDVLHFGKDHMDYGESAKLGAGIVHDLRLGLSDDPAQNAAQTSYGLARIAQVGYLSPHGTNQLITQIRRMAPTLENVLPGTEKQKTDEIVKLAAWADRMGNLPFSGSAISQLTTQMIQPRSGRVLDSMKTLGVYDAKGNDRFFNQQTGEFDLMGALRTVQKTLGDARAAKRAGPAVNAIFGNTQNAQRILSALTSKESMNSYNALSKQMNNMGDDPVAWLNAVQVQLMQQLSTQTMLLKSNFKTLTTYIGDSMLPGLTAFVTALAKITGDLAQFAKDHPRVARVAATGLGVAAAAGGVASLMLGGYVATGLFHGAMKHLNPGLAEKMGEAGTHALQGGWRGVLGTGAKFAGGAMGRAGNVAYRATGLGAFGAARGFGGVAGTAIGDLIKLGPQLLRTRAGFMLIAETLAKLGLRAIPVVGEVLMLIDTIRFLGNNSFSIGKLIGMAAHAVVNGLHAVWDAIVGMVKNIGWVLSHPKDAILGGIKNVGGWAVTSAQNFGKGVAAGWNGNPAPAPAKKNPAPAHGKVVGLATGGRVNADGLAYLHKGETVVNSRLTQRLERGSSGGSIVHSGRIEIALTGSPIANLSSADENCLASKIGDRLAMNMTRDTMYAHGGTQTVGTDNYGGSDYHSRYGVS